MRRPVLGSRNLKQTLGIMIGFFAIQLPLTILGWFRVTSQNLIISSITLLLIVLAVRSVSTIFDYTANDQTQKFKLIPCAIIMVLSQSFVSFLRALYPPSPSRRRRLPMLQPLRSRRGGEVAGCSRYSVTLSKMSPCLIVILMAIAQNTTLSSPRVNDTGTDP